MKKMYICYDLRAPVQNYRGLYAELENLGAVRVLQSLWVMRTSRSPADIRDELSRLLIDHDDGIIVIRAGGSAWRNVITSPSKI